MDPESPAPNKPSSISRGLLGLGLISLAGGAALATGNAADQVVVGPCIVGGIALLALASFQSRHLRGIAFSLWVGTFVAAAMFYPTLFQTWGTFPLKKLITPLIQLIMFGMGTMLSVSDFARVLKMPRAVLVGLLLQFSIMPLLGAALAAAFGFTGQIAAGVVLVGCCPGGVASNVMTYLARGNVALSVTMTACSTLLSPLATPWAMSLLAGQYVDIAVSEMMMGILQMIIVPVLGGLIANHALQRAGWRGPWLDRLLSLLAMSAICFIIAIIVSLSRDQLLHVGAALVTAAVLHNSCGYLLGYWGARLLALNESDCRTVAIEVGLQNGGMASALAVNVLHSTDAALAPAIFGPWMNVSGSVLASWWRQRPASAAAEVPAPRP